VAMGLDRIAPQLRHVTRILASETFCLYKDKVYR
jgi:hypothetical protein